MMIDNYYRKTDYESNSDLQKNSGNEMRNFQQNDQDIIDQVEEDGFEYSDEEELEKEYQRQLYLQQHNLKQNQL